MRLVSSVLKGAVTGYNNYTRPIPNPSKTFLGEYGSALTLIAGVSGTAYLYSKDPFRAAQFAVAVASALGYYKGTFGGAKIISCGCNGCNHIKLRNRFANLGFSFVLSTSMAVSMQLMVTISSPVHVLALAVGATALGALAGGMVTNEICPR